tara:strand:+ start:1081 stop:1326 length:246 start_codon:yes stop_codon:yes gene_type:complete
MFVVDTVLFVEDVDLILLLLLSGHDCNGKDGVFEYVGADTCNVKLFIMDNVTFERYLQLAKLLSSTNSKSFLLYIIVVIFK